MTVFSPLYLSALSWVPCTHSRRELTGEAPSCAYYNTVVFSGIRIDLHYSWKCCKVFFGQFTATTVFLSEIQSALVIFGGVFFIILGLVLLQVVPLPSVLKGLHSIPFPHWLQPQSWWGALLLGGIFAASWSPCIGPVLGGIITACCIVLFQCYLVGHSSFPFPLA